LTAESELIKLAQKLRTVEEQQTSAKVHCRVELLVVVEFVEFVVDAIARLEKAAHDSKIV